MAPLWKHAPLHRNILFCVWAIIIMPVLFHPLTMHIRICRLVALVTDFLLSHINSLLNSRIYVWPEVRRSRFLMLVFFLFLKKKQKKGLRGLQSRPACGEQCKHNEDRHPLLMHWSILAGCEHQGEAVTSRWTWLPCSLLNSTSSTQPAPEDGFLFF